ncbi:MAG: T9SS type A sorting domain-containing protein, partial [bacterium]|nr:T9SS type A sorting domain-containing protein [bacterium]
TGTLSKINIEISIDGGLKWKRQAYGVTNNNSYIINIPGTASAQCLIRVTNAENLSVSDVSNNFFSVQSAPTYPSIEVLSPNGGETITPGSSTNVTWSSTGFTSNVGIRISTDEGANWTTLISSTANDGNENVTMPSENSSKCLIWIYEATTDTYVNQASAFPLDVSDNLFSLGTITIPPPPIANAATNINITSFTANWSTSANATGYYLDVDDDSDFSSPLSAYNDLDIGNVLTYNITGLLAGTNYYYRVRAYNTSTSANSNTIMLTTLPKIDQTITFNTLTAKAYGDASFTISSTGGTSGNPVVFTSSDETVVTCSGASGEIITIINAGVCNIYANQLGNNEYNDAPQVQQTITISPMEITVTTNTNQTKTYGETDPVFSYTTTPSLLNGDSFTGILGREPGENTGEYNIILNSLSAGANYDIDFASDVLTITKAFPVITWLNPDDIYYGTILDNTQLNAASNIDGTFEYSPTSGSLLEVGNNQELSTVFTPTETLNYNSVNKTAYINVLQTSNDLSANGISLYPNPTSGNIKLESEHGDIRQISIFNTLGLKIYQKTNVIQNETINLSEFANGIFIMKIQTENNMYTIKIMKK